jgi:hypothetical protein
MLPSLPDPELFFGFCSPVGVDNKKAFNLLQDALRKYGYSTEYFKVTTLMRSVKPSGFEMTESPLEKRYDSYIRRESNKGNLRPSLRVSDVMLCGST